MRYTEARRLARLVPACSCEKCRECCKRPCWPTPGEARRLIDAGFGDRLMMDYWVASPYIYILSPANVGYERRNAPFWPMGQCTLQKDGLCILHNAVTPEGIPLKPVEARMTHHHPNKNVTVFHESIVALWNTDGGRKIVADWQKRFG